MPDFTGKIGIVTGGASGMGAAAARLFVGHGGKVAIADIDETGGSRLTGELGDAAHFIRCDVSDKADAAAMVNNAVSHFGKLDCLFNNAGKGMMGKVGGMDPATWDEIIAINLSSVFYVSHAAIPHLKAGDGGAIVNTASISGLHGDHAMSAYNSAKAGVINFTRALALDYGPANIRCNAVCPGMIWDTAMTQHLATLPGGWEPWTERTALRRGGNAVEVAHAMMFLASDEASYITGTTLVIDGGVSAQTGFPDISPLLNLPE